MQQLIGRQREIAELDRCMKSGQSEFITVCGRRRIGKTFLIEQYFHQKYAFSYVGGHHLTQEEQLLLAALLAIALERLKLLEGRVAAEHILADRHRECPL